MVVEQRELTAIQRIDGAQPPLGLAAHGAYPERAGRMDTGIVRTRCGIVGLERTVQFHPPIRRIANIETVIGDEKLAMGVDPPKRAAHHFERMDGGPPGVGPRLEQPALDDVKPPGGVSGGVIGRSLTKMASLATENGRRYLFHFAVAAHRPAPSGDSTADCVSIAP